MGWEIREEKQSLQTIIGDLLTVDFNDLNYKAEYIYI